MTYDPQLHHRQSFRWKGYDYSARGLYFVTMCTYRRAAMLSRITDCRAVLTGRGKIAHATWLAIPRRFPTVELGPSVFMPNHLHAILAIVARKESREGAASSAPTDTHGAASAPALGEIIRAFKSLSTLSIHRQFGSAGHLWQRNYYEHVVRDGKEYGIISRYIWENPTRWETDPENAAAQSPSNALPWELPS
jgi:REP element-mobilizing transposase RayT